MAMKRNPFVSRFEHAFVRPFMLDYLYDRLGLIMVAEFPKSGGTWFSQMLSAYLGIPYPRNQVPALKKSIMHGHYLYKPRYNPAFVVCRDGRDVMVSWYHHCVFDHGFNHYMVKRVRADLGFSDYHDVKGNLPRFIEYSFETGKPLGITWVSFMESWIDRVPYIVKYESLLNDAASEMATAVGQILGIKATRSDFVEISNRFSFKNMAGRRQGDEKKNAFLRKGISGDWKNYFNSDAEDVFNYYGGVMLDRLGYTCDHN